MDTILTVDQVAQQLDLKPKTIRHYISEGLLKAEKIGKQWRIHDYDLQAFLKPGTSSVGETVYENTPRNISSRINVSTVVDIAVQDARESQMICNTLIAMLNSKDRSYGQASMKTSFTGNNLKIILWGSAWFMSVMLECISMYEEGEHGKSPL